jgi:hypothetical protein
VSAIGQTYPVFAVLVFGSSGVPPGHGRCWEHSIRSSESFEAAAHAQPQAILAIDY